MIYLDNSATTRPLPGVVDVMTEAMGEAFFNPSAAYGPAVKLQRRVDTVRRDIGLVCGRGGSVTFTSGGTEGNNTVLRAMAAQGKLLCSAVEHPSVLAVCRLLGGEVIPVDAHGFVDMEQLAALLTPDVSLVSVMHVNNETGAVQDLAAIRSLLREKAPKARLHVDGVQAFCRLTVPAEADYYTFSAHKIHGPKGIGGIYAANGVRFAPLLAGGGQEGDRRSGTENVPGILGMGAAVNSWRQHGSEWTAHMRGLNDLLWSLLQQHIPDAVRNSPENGAPHILNVSFPGVRGETLLHALEGSGIYVSTGSACSSHKQQVSPVLKAMGKRDELAGSAIRFSLCPFNTEEEMIKTAITAAEQVKMLHRFQRR